MSLSIGGLARSQGSLRVTNRARRLAPPVVAQAPAAAIGTLPAAAHTAAAPASNGRLAAQPPPPPTAPPALGEPLLAHEIVQGALVCSEARSTRSRPPPTAVLLHGILGRRQNLQRLAQRLVEGFPHWQVVLMDLRCHGESAALAPPPRPPHGLEAAAGDVIRTLSALRLFPEVLIGHSFGGKVVLQMTRHWSAAAVRPPRPVQVWVLDALPGEVRSGDMGGGGDRPADLLTTLQALPLPVPSRRWLIGHLEASGFSRQVAAWAATNLALLAGGVGGLGWSFDLAGIAQLFRSYETADLWPLLASPAEGVRVSFVRAERSTFRWGGGDEARIRALGHEVHLHRGVGHWLHHEDPEGLFRILAPSFSGSSSQHSQHSPPGSPPASPGWLARNAAGASAARQLQGLML